MIRSERVPEELWMEICDIIQEARIKTIPKKKKCKKETCFSEEALQIAAKRREAKDKGEEFQRRARRDNKAFLSDQCKQRKTTEWERPEISSRKLATEETFHEKKGTIKNRKDMDLTAAEDKKRWQEYTEEL